jgi:hypothetical protein
MFMLVVLWRMDHMPQVLVEHDGLPALLVRPLLLFSLLSLVLLLIYLVLLSVFICGVVHTWNSFQL